MKSTLFKVSTIVATTLAVMALSLPASSAEAADILVQCE